ncbi:MAG: undecaprenyl/decaprenyl-phosphate alpha-N-acetylglucosaminyl 1-phosphate transferase [Clostridiales bacterium]|nr:undecaprenyl/decaprenyl-phosphate alpha-N-acetylglucosaminyl 1-phosphate transferase [Clostridiales bacterium]
MDTELIFLLLVTLGVSFLVSFAATPLVKQFAQRIGAMDVPKDERRMHNIPIARIGGLAIFFGFMSGVLLFSDIDRELRGILFGSVIIVVMAMIDDLINLKAWIKLIVQIVAALVAIWHGVVIEVISNPNIFSSNPWLVLGAFSIPVTVIWIVAITNSVNYIDGLDGLAVGVSSISSISMLVIAILVSEPNVAVVMAALAGGCIGFMPYNLNPAKIFMGDTGALFIGYILATISIQGLFKFYAIMSFAVPFLILALPIFDFVFAFFRRLLAGKNPMAADRGHVHHRLIDMGLNQKQAVAIMYVLSGILGLTAVVLTASGELRAMLLIIGIIIVGGLSVKTYFSYRPDVNSRRNGIMNGKAHAMSTNTEINADANERDMLVESDHIYVQADDGIISDELKANDDASNTDVSNDRNDRGNENA